MVLLAIALQMKLKFQKENLLSNLSPRKNHNESYLMKIMLAETHASVVSKSTTKEED